MKYLVKTEALWTQNREDIQEVLYNEVVDIIRGYGLCHSVETMQAMLPRGYNVCMEVKDADRRSLDQLITAYQKKQGEEPVEIAEPEETFYVVGQAENDAAEARREQLKSEVEVHWGGAPAPTDD